MFHGAGVKGRGSKKTMVGFKAFWRGPIKCPNVDEVVVWSALEYNFGHGGFHSAEASSWIKSLSYVHGRSPKSSNGACKCPHTTLISLHDHNVP